MTCFALCKLGNIWQTIRSFNCLTRASSLLCAWMHIENNNKIMEALVQHDTDATIVDE